MALHRSCCAFLRPALHQRVSAGISTSISSRSDDKEPPAGDKNSPNEEPPAGDKDNPNKEPPAGDKDSPRPRTGGRRLRKRIAHTWFKPDEVNVDAPWSSVWQGPRSFDPYMVPFPVYMGRPLKGELPPPALGNLELMKIPNFLHLTPPAIEKHCQALKPLCTPWPEKLPFMPLKIETRNYVFPGHSVKHPGSKHVVISFKLSDLGLSKHGRNKMIQLAGRRYKAETDTVRLFAGRCPTRTQNMDYAMYLLKVLYLESNKVEPWEEEDGH